MCESMLTVPAPWDTGALTDPIEVMIVDDAESAGSVKTNVILTKRLIRQVRLHRVLYDPTHKRFSSATAKSDAWADIARRLKCDVDVCTNTWINLRYSYQHYVRRLRTYFANPGGRGNGKKRPKRRPVMAFEMEMMFLWRFIHPKIRCPLPYDNDREEKAVVAVEPPAPEDDDIVLVEDDVEVIDLDDDVSYTTAHGWKHLRGHFLISPEMRRLLASIEPYPELYNTYHRYYGDFRRKGIIWNGIANEVGDKATKLMKCWIQMQTRYEWEIMQRVLEGDLSATKPKSELESLLEFFKPYIINTSQTVYKCSHFLKETWHEPIDHFKNIFSLLVVMKKFPLVISYTESQINSSRGKKSHTTYITLWGDIATARGSTVSPGQCEVTWLILRSFYWELVNMRKDSYQLQDKWYFESIISELYTLAKNEKPAHIKAKEGTEKAKESPEMPCTSAAGAGSSASSSPVPALNKGESPNLRQIPNRIVPIPVNLDEDKISSSKIITKNNKSSKNHRIKCPSFQPLTSAISIAPTPVSSNELIVTLSKPNIHTELQSTTKLQSQNFIPFQPGTQIKTQSPFQSQPTPPPQTLLQSQLQAPPQPPLQSRHQTQFQFQPQPPLQSQPQTQFQFQPQSQLPAPPSTQFQLQPHAQFQLQSPMPLQTQFQPQLQSPAAPQLPFQLSPQIQAPDKSQPQVILPPQTQSKPQIPPQLQLRLQPQLQAQQQLQTLSLPQPQSLPLSQLQVLPLSQMPSQQTQPTQATLPPGELSESLAKPDTRPFQCQTNSNASKIPNTVPKSTTSDTIMTPKIVSAVSLAPRSAFGTPFAVKGLHITAVSSSPAPNPSASTSSLSLSPTVPAGPPPVTEPTTTRKDVPLNLPFHLPQTTNIVKCPPLCNISKTTESTPVQPKIKNLGRTIAPKPKLTPNSQLNANEIMIELISSVNGNQLVVHGPPLEHRYSLSMSTTTMLIREVLSIPQLHNTNNKPGQVHKYWQYLSNRFDIPVHICKACWNFLSENFNHFPQIAPLEELTKPVKLEIIVWSECSIYFHVFTIKADSLGLSASKDKIMQFFDIISAQARAVPRISGKKFAFVIDWKSVLKTVPEMDKIWFNIWVLFKNAFTKFMHDIESGIINTWPMEWWRCLAKLDFLLEEQYHNMEPFYYIVKNQVNSEMARCLQEENRIAQLPKKNASQNSTNPNATVLKNPDLPKIPDIDPYRLVLAIRRHPVIYQKSTEKVKNEAWQQVADELNTTVEVCRFAFQWSFKNYRYYVARDISNRCRLNQRYYKHLAEIYRSVKQHGKLNIRTPLELNQSVEPNEAVFPERFVMGIDMISNSTRLVMKNWAYGIGTMPASSGLQASKLKSLFLKYSQYDIS